MATDGVKVSNTEITQTFDVWRRQTNDAADRLNSITQSFMNDRITLTGNVEVGSTFVADTDNNRVGIGTTTPAVKLDVDGVTNISDDLKVGISGGGTANLIVDVSTNRVGINTNAPTEALDVTGKVLVSDDLMISGAASNVLFVDTSGTSVGINVDAPTASSLEISGDVLLQNTDELKIKNNGGTSQTVLTVNASDSTILQGSGGTQSVAIKSSDGTSRITMTEAGVTAFTANVSIPDNKVLSFGDFNDLLFYHDATDSYVQSTTGSLNIQTTFANSIVLEQGGAVTLYFSNTANNPKLATTTLGVDIIGSANVSNDLLVSTATNASNTLFVDVSTQSVGVNNDAPTQALDVIGNILSSATIEGPTITDGTATITGGTVSATAFTTGSFSGTTGTFSSLAEDRIIFAGTAGLLEDSADLTFDGTTFEVGGGYGATGVDIDMDGNISTNGNIISDGTLTVDGLSSLDGGIDVNTSAFTVSSAGAVDTSSTLTVDGLSSLDGGIDVNATKFEVATDGAITTSNTLTVVGSSFLGGGIDVNGAFVVATDGGVTISDTLDVTDITTLSANLIVDTDTLFVDTANNRVGINISTPQHAFDVVGDINLTGGTIKASGSSTADYYLKVNSAGTGMEYVDIQAVLSGNGVVSKPLSAPFPNAIGNERDVTMWQSNTVITGNTNMLTYDLSTGQLNVKSNGTGSAILSIQDTGAGNNAELVKDESDLKIRSGGGNIKFSGVTDSTNISVFQVYANNALQNIMHTGNGGPGTNFDADLLDGQHGYEYSRLVNTTSASTAAGEYNKIIEWAAGSNSDTAVVLTLLITSNRSDTEAYNGSCSALVQVSLVQNDSSDGLQINPDIQLLSYSSYGSGSTEDIIENILIASTGTTIPTTQSVYIKSKIANEVFTVQVLSESKTGSGVQDVTYPNSSWTTIPSGIRAQTGKIVRQSADFLPKRNNVYDLGSTTDRWAIIYGANGNFSDTVTGPSGTWDSGGIDIASGDSYAISGTNVLTATALGSGVTSSSLTSVGTLNSGSITSGFGNINIGSSTFTGNGSGLTNLVAANISTGSLTDGVNLHYTEDNATATPYFVSFTNANGLDGSGNKDSLFSDKFSFTPSTGRITSNQISVNASGLIIGGSAVTATAAELNVLTGYTGSVTELNYLDTLHATGVTSTEFDYLDGVTDNIQTQLGTKQATITGGASTITSSNLTASRALISNASGKVAVSTVTSTELGYVSGVTSAIQTQLNTLDTDKAPLASPGFTGTATGVNLTLSGNLTVNGTTTTLNTTNTVVSDNLIELNNGVSSNPNDSGIVIERGSTGDNAFIGWDESADKFIVGTTTATGSSTGNLTIAAGTLVAGTFEGNVTGDVTGDLTGNAGTATKWQTARNLTISGDATATFSSVDGSAAVNAALTIADDAVTYAKMQNVASDDRILGNIAGAGQPVAELTAANVRTMINVEDGANAYTLPQATATVRGGIEIFSNTTQTVGGNSVSATAGRTYGIQLDSSGRAVVNVPWTDTNSGGTVTGSGSNDRVAVWSGGSSLDSDSAFTFNGSTNTLTVTNISVDSIVKNAGSFKIRHPLKLETHNLVHSFIEGPQADNLYRGRVDLVDGSATVNIDARAGMTEGTFVVLNRDVQCFVSNESGWTAVKGSVSGNILTITAQDNTCTDTVSWLVVGERQDREIYESPLTDENGKIVVEPLAN